MINTRDAVCIPLVSICGTLQTHGQICQCTSSNCTTQEHTVQYSTTQCTAQYTVRRYSRQEVPQKLEVKMATVSKNLLSHVGHHSDLGEPRDQGVFATVLQTSQMQRFYSESNREHRLKLNF